ncbi:hypothetical protein HanIR_Chr13g0644241 [Helianthus annuus]|nr:hypothetical protein HanIR_Chr13g0644241 [Helianthus annuus]
MKNREYGLMKDIFSKLQNRRKQICVAVGFLKQRPRLVIEEKDLKISEIFLCNLIFVHRLH